VFAHVARLEAWIGGDVDHAPAAALLLLCFVR
jgi:hypothetical protein